jgi:hypothetical protein
MALTETYVDPSIAGDSGTGTIGDPYGDIQYALDTMTRDGSNGDRLNIKAGTDEILGAALSLATYGTPTVTAQLVFQGYTSAAADGGIGGIDGNGTYTMITPNTLDYIGFIDMHLHNSGLATNIVDLDNNISIVNCELDLGNIAITADNLCEVINCYIHNCDNVAIDLGNGSVAFGNYIENDTNDFVTAITSVGGTQILGNIINIDGATVGIIPGDGCLVWGNSIYSSSGTGTGINNQSSKQNTSISNNILEGFSGVGGVGIINAGIAVQLGFNAFYNNTTNLTDTGTKFIDYTANDQALSASPFINASAGDFRVNKSVKALAFPIDNFPNLSVRSYLDIGALQRAADTVYGMKRIPI